jgi:hypothetical protein
MLQDPVNIFLLGLLRLSPTPFMVSQKHLNIFLLGIIHIFDRGRGMNGNSRDGRARRGGRRR